jgi:exodeoxyribonuclease-3
MFRLFGMKIISVNVNGIRSAASKGFFTWLGQQNADVVCLQEVRANIDQLSDQVFHPHGYKDYFCCAKKSGYSGVAIYCKQEPDKVVAGLGWDLADEEARYLEIQYGNLHIASIYLPSGTSGEDRQKVKYKFLDHYLEILKKQIKSHKPYVICGDFNIAHTNNDIKNWRSNQKNSGFLPEERAWLDQVFNEVGFVDAWRHFNPDKVEYTWWSQRANARANNVGWRIDYQIITPDLASKIKHTSIYNEQKFSDHAPLIIDYAL